MTISYFVDTSFGLHQINGIDYIQANKFSAKIRHAGLKNFLSHLLENKVALLTQAELSSMATQFNIDKTALQDFLIKQTGLLKVNIADQQLNTLAIFGEGEVTEQLIHAFQNKTELTINRYSLAQEIKSDNTIAVYYSPYHHPAEIKKLYTLSANQNNYFVTSYLMNEYFIIDNIYSKQAGLPCHFCHLERLKVNSSLIPNGQNKSWLSYYREILKENQPVMFEKNLPPIYANYIAYCLYQFIRRLIDPFCPEWHYDQYIQFWHVHLDKMTITEEAASFWPYCSCQNG